MAGSELKNLIFFGGWLYGTVIMTFITGAPVVPVLCHGWGALMLGVS